MPNTYDNLATSDREMKLNSASRATLYRDSFFSLNNGPNGKNILLWNILANDVEYFILFPVHFF